MTDIFINDSGGYRILMKNSNLFSKSFSTDFMFKYNSSNDLNPTFPGDNTGNNTRIILFAMGGGSANANKGVVLLLEKYNDKEYITGIFNSDKTSGWNQYLPGLKGEDGINGIEIGRAHV